MKEGEVALAAEDLVGEATTVEGEGALAVGAEVDLMGGVVAVLVGEAVVLVGEAVALEVEVLLRGIMDQDKTPIVNIFHVSMSMIMVKSAILSSFHIRGKELGK